MISHLYYIILDHIFIFFLLPSISHERVHDSSILLFYSSVLFHLLLHTSHSPSFSPSISLSRLVVCTYLPSFHFLYFIFIPVNLFLLSIPFSLSIISLHILSNSLTFTRITISSTPRRKLLVLLHYRHSLEELVKK